MEEFDKECLLPTAIIDSDNEIIIKYAMDVVGDSGDDPVSKAVKLYYAVRDNIRYDPYCPSYLPEHFRASNVIKSGRGYCVSKASLLCALGRASHIPSRIGLANVRNHLATRQLIEHLGNDIFACHGFVEFYLEGKWVKATPAFNKELCDKHKVSPLEFNGREDSIFHAYNLDNKKFMEYIEFHGSFTDVPVDFIVTAYEKTYGRDRIRTWIDNFEKSGGKSVRDFYKEKVLKGA